MDEELKQYVDHFSDGYNDEIKKYAESLFPDYLFTHRLKGQQYGYCTVCQKKYKTDGLQHKAKTNCALCGADLFVQSVGMGRSKMINEAYFIYYEKSVIDPNVIVARGIYAVEDFRKDYRNIKPKMADKTLYVFRIGQATMLKRYVWYDSYNFSFGSPYWGSFKSFEKTSTIHSELSVWANSHYARGIACYCRDSIAAAVLGTPFQYSMWTEYHDEPMVKFFDLYCKYPKAVENLTKLGFKRLIDAKLTGDNTCGAVNWRGQTVFEILRLNRLELKQLRGSSLILRPFYIRLFQINKKDSNRLNMYELCEVENAFGTNQAKDILAITKHTALKKAFNYIKEQYRACKDSKGSCQFHSIVDVLINYRDYIKDCETLEMDMRKETVLFPKSLYSAHQNTITQVKVKENEKFNEKISKRVPGLNKKYCFEYDGLLIRPARNSKELIEEGKALNHCVGTYAERYANGQTNILFIRKASKPDKPFYTMEIKEDNIIQTRGNRNCSPDKQVLEFIEAFKSKILERKERLKVSLPA